MVRNSLAKCMGTGVEAVWVVEEVGAAQRVRENQFAPSGIRGGGTEASQFKWDSPEGACQRLLDFAHGLHTFQGAGLLLKHRYVFR